MNTSPPPAPVRPARHLFNRRRGWVVLAAFAAGLLLFLLIWRLDQPKTFYKSEPNTGVVGGSQVQVFEPLPAPMPADAAGGASQLPGAQIEGRQPPARIIQQAPHPAPSAAPAPALPASAARPYARSSAPVPISQPAPRYPAAALRAGVGGLVRVSVEVGPDGVPISVGLAQGSGSRDLDRAAIDAVRRWRFRPATDNGQPSVGRVTVPIEFKVNP